MLVTFVVYYSATKFYGSIGSYNGYRNKDDFFTINKANLSIGTPLNGHPWIADSLGQLRKSWMQLPITLCIYTLWIADTSLFHKPDTVQFPDMASTKEKHLSDCGHIYKCEKLWEAIWMLIKYCC